MTDRVQNPIGAVLPQPHPSAANPDADPDLERWQRDRWAPHSFEPVTGQRRSERAREVRDRLQARADAEQPVSVEPRPVAAPAEVKAKVTRARKGAK